MLTRTQWTQAAADHARRQGLEAALQSLQLSAAAQVDDYVELPGAQGAVTFIVRKRTWQTAPDGVWQLNIQLDYPPRPSGLR